MLLSILQISFIILAVTYLLNVKIRTIIQIYVALLFSKLSIGYAKYIFAQVMYESNDFKSDLYKKANNLVGMRVAGQRQQNLKGVYKTNHNGTFALYGSKYDSIVDLIRLLDNYMPKKAPDNFSTYCAILKDNGYYAESYEYYYTGASTKLKYFRIANLSALVVLFSMILVMLAGLYLFVKRFKK